MCEIGELYSNKENLLAESPHHPTIRAQINRIRHSSSHFSLKSIIASKKSNNINLIVVSQPTLDDSSREKLRNKVRQSPSMMSICGFMRRPELVQESERRLINELLAFTETGAFESNLEEKCRDTEAKHFEHCDLRYVNSQDVLNKLQIHASLKKCITEDGSRFLPIDSVHMEQVNDEEYLCVLSVNKQNYAGTRLDKLQITSPAEGIDIIFKLTRLLAKAEEQLNFEHRNLHAGNIIVHAIPSVASGNSDSSHYYSGISHITVINWDLGRLDLNLYTSLDHPKFYQARLPVLHEMRKVVEDPSAYYPITNVMWLSYIVRFLYNQHPCHELSRIQTALDPPKWKMRRKPHSACDALQIISKYI